MFETRHEKIASISVFIGRVLLNLFIGFLLIALCLFIGMFGYRHYESMSWVDAYMNAAMILSGMGPANEIKTTAGKIFAGSYALFSGIIFLFFMAMIFAPILHRVYHRFHVKEQEEEQDFEENSDKD